MAETAHPDALTDTLDYGSEAEPSTLWSSLILLASLAIGAWIISFMLPANPPFIRKDTWENWAAFGFRVLRDILRSFGLLCAALGIGSGLPHIGRLLERVIFRSRLAVFLVACAIISALLSAVFNYVVFDHMPHIQDEIAMEFQAKILATGRLAAPAPRLGDFFDCEFIIGDSINHAGKWYGKYFIGQALCLVPGEWVGMPWLVHPLLGGLVVWLTYAIGAGLWSDRLGRLAALLMTLSPFRMVTFAMTLGHASSLMMLGLFALAMVKLVRDPRRWGWALTGGLALGLAGNSRPLTAVSIGGAICFVTAAAMPWRKLRPASVVAFGLGLGLFVLVLFGYNKALTGNPRLTPFNQWSRSDRLGFGPEVGLEYWREQDKGHTLRKGLLKDVYFNLEALRANQMGWGGIIFFLMVVPLLMSRYWKMGLALAAPPAAVAAIHVLHVSHGVLAGQARYWSESMPMMLLLVAVGLLAVRSWLPHAVRWLGLAGPVQSGRSAFWVWCILMTLWAIPNSFMPIVSECIGEFWGQGPTVRDQARAQHIDHALVFIKSGNYRTHFRGGVVDLYPCGFMLNDPDLKGPVVYARDLGAARNAALIAQYPGRSVYRVDPGAGHKIRFKPYVPSASTRESSDEEDDSTLR